MKLVIKNKSFFKTKRNIYLFQDPISTPPARPQRHRRVPPDPRPELHGCSERQRKLPSRFRLRKPVPLS